MIGVSILAPAGTYAVQKTSNQTAYESTEENKNVGDGEEITPYDINVR